MEAKDHVREEPMLGKEAHSSEEAAGLAGYVELANAGCHASFEARSKSVVLEERVVVSSELGIAIKPMPTEVVGDDGDQGVHRRMCRAAAHARSPVIFAMAERH